MEQARGCAGGGPAAHGPALPPASARLPRGSRTSPRTSPTLRPAANSPRARLRHLDRRASGAPPAGCPAHAPVAGTRPADPAHAARDLRARPAPGSSGHALLGRSQLTCSGQPLPGIFAYRLEHAKRWLQLILWLVLASAQVRRQSTRLLGSHRQEEALLGEREQPAQCAPVSLRLPLRWPLSARSPSTSLSTAAMASRVTRPTNTPRQRKSRCSRSESRS